MLPNDIKIYGRCKNGHLRTRENTRTTPSKCEKGWKVYCYECKRIQAKIDRILGPVDKTPRACDICGKDFVPEKRRQRLCTKPCRTKFWAKNNRKHLNAYMRRWNKKHPGYASASMRRLAERFERKNGIPYHAFIYRQEKLRDIKLAMQRSG